jgi:PAS domain S-box-containing protein
MDRDRYSPRMLWRGLALVVVPGLALAALALFHARYIDPALQRSQAGLAHTFDVLATARRLGLAIADAERGQHGYVITGDQRYLDAYRRAADAAPARLAELERLTADDRDHRRRLRLLRQHLDAKLAELQQTIAVRRDQGFDAARQIVESRVGFNAMAVITGILDNVIEAENKALRERRGQALALETDDEHVGLLVAGLGLAVAVLGTGLLSVAFVRNARAAARLADSEERFRLLVAQVQDHAIFMLDPVGRVVSWNEGAERIKGYRAEEIIGRHFSCFYPEEAIAARVPQQHLQQASAQGSHESEGWRLRKDGSRFWADGVITALRGPDGRLRGFAKVTRDVSERRQQQQALEQSRAALAQAQKMEAVGQLTGGVAHDFNNLLTTIIGSSELLAGRADSMTPQQQRLLTAIRQAADRGAALTRRLLAFARRQPLAPQDTDANRLVAAAAEMLRRTLGEDICIETVLADGLWHCNIDPPQLDSALLNLAVNARDAMPEGGRLTIATAKADLDAAYAAAHSEVAAGQYVMIKVSDTGAGMSPEVVEHAFEPFFTTKGEARGTGLGLSQVYGFVKQSGGHVELDSEPGHGTTVTIYLPRHRGPAAPPAAEPLPAAASAGGETVLLVEDDPDVREFGAAALAQLGYSVLDAADAAAALTLLDAHPEVSLLFTDLGLPGLDGRQLADEARRRLPHLRVLLTTGYTRDAITHDGALDPDIQLLPKPFSIDDLARQVQRALREA